MSRVYHLVITGIGHLCLERYDRKKQERKKKVAAASNGKQNVQSSIEAQQKQGRSYTLKGRLIKMALSCI
jgi:hypothetical protein